MWAGPVTALYLSPSATWMQTATAKGTPRQILLLWAMRDDFERALTLKEDLLRMVNQQFNLR